MGWFENDQEKSSTPLATTPMVAPKTAPQPPSAGSASVDSNLGRQITVEGTIIAEENLTIFGKVEGTIRAERMLVIAKEGQVDAAIFGRRIHVNGTVHGNLHGSESVLLGTTASVTGNIETPALRVEEGAYLKGEVEMAAPTTATGGPTPTAVGEASQGRVSAAESSVAGAPKAAKRSAPAAPSKAAAAAVRHAGSAPADG